MGKLQINTDCLYFNGYKPCSYHKKENVHCNACDYYKPIKFRVLILKIGAAGEVLRNTTILRKIKNEMLDAEITWITEYPDFVPSNYVDRIFEYNWKNINMILSEEFDLLLSLDKEHDICAIANSISARKKKGFLLNKYGKIIPADNDSERKWLTGIFDDLMLKNKKHYVEEIFEICGWNWNGERYIIGEYEKLNINFKTSKKVIGLNTGAGSLWPTRIWPIKHWESLIKSLTSKYTVIVLGGPDEKEKNEYLSGNYDVKYLGVRTYKEFIGIVDNCDLVVTAVTLALHIGIALEKKIILFNNIFNKHEFYLYGLGEIIEPPVTCKGCYSNNCNKKFNGKGCMELLEPVKVYETINKLLDN